MPVLDRMFGESPQSGFWAVSPGVVKENHNDDHPGMVKVELLMQSKGLGVTHWLRVVTPYAGKKYGAYLLPEVGDEVLVAVDHFDTQTGYVIGSLWNDSNTRPAGVVTEGNKTKRLVTKGGCEITLGDEDSKQRIELKTPAALTVLLDDDKKTISLTAGDNSIILNSGNGEVTVTAKSKMTLKAGSSTLILDGNGMKSTLKGDTCVVEGSQKTDISGASLSIKGTSATVEGSGGLTVKSGGVLTLKGSLTKIN